MKDNMSDKEKGFEQIVQLLDPALIDWIIRSEMKASYEMAEEKKDRKAARRMHNYYSVWSDYI